METKRLDEFMDSLEDSTLPASARLTYLVILAEQNRFGNQEFVSITDRRLAQLTGLTRPTVQDAKRRLKNAGLVDFQTTRAAPRDGTRYTWPKTLPKTLPNATMIAGGVCPRARSNDPMDHLNILEEKTSSATTDRAREDLAKTDVQDYWREITGEYPRGGFAMRLLHLEQEHGAQVVKDAIQEAYNANKHPRLSVNFFLAVLKNRLKEVTHENSSASIVHAPNADDYFNHQALPWEGDTDARAGADVGAV